MTIYLHKEPDKCTKAFDLLRYKDQNGVFIEKRNNKLPRGKTWKVLSDMNWKYTKERLNKLDNQIKTYTDEINCLSQEK